MLHRTDSTFTQELSRNREQSGDGSCIAQRISCKRLSQCRPACRQQPHLVLSGIVRTFICSLWSAAQIALTLTRPYRKGHQQHMSHKTVVTCSDAQPMVEFREEMNANLHHARNMRTPCSKDQERRCQPPPRNARIHVRPPEVQNRLFPAHREAGATGSSASWAPWSRTPSNCSCWSSCITSSRPVE